MKSSILNLLLAVEAVFAAIAPRQVTSGCCFHLDSAGVVNETVEEDHGGNLVLGGAFQQGGFCLQNTTGAIKDSLGHNCFMRAPNYQFECYAGALGPSVFEFLPYGDGGKTKLAYDNGNGTFLACPFASGTGEQSYDIFSTAKANTAGCLKVALIITDPTSECDASNATLTTASSMAGSTSQASLSSASTPAFIQQDTTTPLVPSTAARSISTTSPQPTHGSIQSTKTSSATEFSTALATASPTCSVSPSAPSLAPRKIGYSKDGTLDCLQDTYGAASITNTNSTIFEYSIPRSFVKRQKQRCGLQFRFPFCSDLPSGYPCFQFSGSEQEFLSDSGMLFSSITDDGILNWNDTALHQVNPGDQVILGTFECGRAAGSKGKNRKLSWLASSVRGFGLQFLQAGVGVGSQFEDGVGAWIVPCS